MFNIFIEVKKSDKIELNKENSKETIPSPLFSMVAVTQMTEFRLRMGDYSQQM